MANPSSTLRPPHGPWNSAASIESAIPSWIVTVEEDRKIGGSNSIRPTRVHRNVGQVGAGARPFDGLAHGLGSLSALGAHDQALDTGALTLARDFDRRLHLGVGPEQKRPRQRRVVTLISRSEGYADEILGAGSF